MSRNFTLFILAGMVLGLIAGAVCHAPVIGATQTRRSAGAVRPGSLSC